MKTVWNAVLASAALALAFSNPAAAGVINFEDISAGGKLASIGKANPYHALVWSNSWYLGDTSVAGYGNAARSGTQFVANGFGVNNLGVSSATAFDFAGAWFATPGTNGAKASWINILAYDLAGQLIGSTGNVAIGAAYVWIAADFANVGRLTITRDKGWFVMDDFTVLDARAVPEPGTPALLLLALGALALVRRKN